MKKKKNYVYKNHISKYDGSKINEAAEKRDLKVCEHIIEKLNIQNTKDKNSKMDDNWIPLAIAAYDGHLDVCKLIMRNIEEIKIH